MWTICVRLEASSRWKWKTRNKINAFTGCVTDKKNEYEFIGTFFETMKVEDLRSALILHNIS